MKSWEEVTAPMEGASGRANVDAGEEVASTGDLAGAVDGEYTSGSMGRCPNKGRSRRTPKLRFED